MSSSNRPSGWEGTPWQNSKEFGEWYARQVRARHPDLMGPALNAAMTTDLLNDITDTL